MRIKTTPIQFIAIKMPFTVYSIYLMELVPDCVPYGGETLDTAHKPQQLTHSRTHILHTPTIHRKLSIKIAVISFIHLQYTGNSQ